MSSSSIKVITLQEDVSGYRLGVANPFTEESSVRESVKHVKVLIDYASQIGVKTIVLPFNTLHKLSENTEAGNTREVFFHSKNPLVKAFAGLAKLKHINIVLLGVLERRGGKIYYSNMLINDSGHGTFFGRKILVSQREALLGINQGFGVEVVSEGNLRFAALLGEDALMPELARLAATLGAQLLLVAPMGCVSHRNLEKLVSSLSFFAGLITIGVNCESPLSSEHEASGCSIAVAMPDLGTTYSDSGLRNFILTLPYKVIYMHSKGVADEQLIRIAKIYASYLRRRRGISRLKLA
ncbi:MAG: nitrilase-related carbon-nitrogen hydrolase [Desulfurococcaceae archaeon]|jgi:predicted amidohydrolase